MLNGISSTLYGPLVKPFSMKHIHYENDAAHRIQLKRNLEKFESDGLIKLQIEGKKVKIRMI